MNDQLNFTRIKRFRDNILLTTDHGGWAIITEIDYLKMLKSELDKETYNLLLSKGIILTEDNILPVITDYKTKYDNFYMGTHLHLVIPTTRCNQRCIYCHSNAVHPSLREQTMDQQTADRVLDFIFQSPSSDSTIEFQGGESLAAFDIVEYIVKKSRELNRKKKKKLRFEIVTNLTLMNDHMIGFIAKNKIKICTSLDGPKDVHDRNRTFIDGGGTYDSVSRMITRLKNENIDVGMIMVVTRYSLPFWKEIIHEYLRFGQDSIRLKYIDYLGFAKNEWEKIGYTIEEFKDFWRNAVDYMFDLNKKGIFVYESNVDLVLRKLYGKQDPNFLDVRSPCGMVTGQLAYNFNGDIYCCDEGRSDPYYILGNVKKDHYQDIMHSAKTKELVGSSIAESFLCDACVYKPFCGVCPVLSRAENKKLLTFLPRDNHCKVYKFIFDYVFDKIISDPRSLKRLYMGFKLRRMLYSALEKNHASKGEFYF
ncbi:MAG: His-Xaa-Ser system radical SAM maturase HxsB [Candidatus Omnitrophota bacterium]